MNFDTFSFNLGPYSDEWINFEDIMLSEISQSQRTNTA